MNRLCIVLAGLVLLATCATTSAQDEDGISVGIDLFQLARPFVPGQPPQTTPLPVATFDGIDFIDHPLIEYDFGTGPLDVGNASIITQRNHAIDNIEDDTASVGIDILAMSLRSVDPIDVGGSNEFLYTVLDDSPGALNGGGFDVEFDQFSPPNSGSVNSTFRFGVQFRIGAPDGPVFDTREYDLRTDFGISWRHFPNEVTPFNEPDHVIDGVNFNLPGAFGNGDFFLEPGQGLTMDPIFIPNDPILLAVEHANADGPGGTADDPILPDMSGGGSFTFLDVPGVGWFDPPTTSGYLYATDGLSQFTSIYLPTVEQVPDGDGEYLVIDETGSTTVNAGAFYFFPFGGVDEFEVHGINPLVDGTDPTAFPVYLTFNQDSNTFTQTAVPEPTLPLRIAVFALLVGGVRSRCNRG